jgi:hypothetical protein
LIQNVLSKVFGYLAADQTTIVGGLATLVVLLADKLHVVVSHASLVAILAPFITSAIAALDKKYGVVKKVVFTPSKAA